MKKRNVVSAIPLKCPEIDPPLDFSFCQKDNKIRPSEVKQKDVYITASGREIPYVKNQMNEKKTVTERGMFDQKTKDKMIKQNQEHKKDGRIEKAQNKEALDEFNKDIGKLQEQNQILSQKIAYLEKGMKMVLDGKSMEKEYAFTNKLRNEREMMYRLKKLEEAVKQKNDKIEELELKIDEVNRTTAPQIDYFRLENEKNANNKRIRQIEDELKEIGTQRQTLTKQSTYQTRLNQKNNEINSLLVEISRLKEENLKYRNDINILQEVQEYNNRVSQNLPSVTDEESNLRETPTKQEEIRNTFEYSIEQIDTQAQVQTKPIKDSNDSNESHSMTNKITALKEKLNMSNQRERGQTRYTHTGRTLIEEGQNYNMTYKRYASPIITRRYAPKIIENQYSSNAGVFDSFAERPVTPKRRSVQGQITSHCNI